MRGFALCAVILLSASGTALANPPETYPLAKVHRGQTGYGMTTFAGDTPEKFSFEVVSVVHNFLPKQDIILVKSDDPKMQLSGFWQGMSGSPLYLSDGGTDKLLCAFSYGFRFNKAALGGCTPIDYMKKEGLDTFRRNAAVQLKAGGPGIVQHQPAATMADWRRLTDKVDITDAMSALGPAHKSWIASAPLPEPIARPQPVDGDTLQASVPLSISGFSAPAYAELSKLFAGTDLVPVRAGGATTSPSELGPKQFVMGGAIAVELIRGDLSAAAVGTVSYVDHNKILAFGHPMFQSGETYAPVSTASVHTVVPSSQSAFVMATAMNEVGSLVQDRQAEIMADTDIRSPMIPVDITITSGAKGHEETGTFHTEVLDNKFFTAPLAAGVVAAAIQYYVPDRDDVTARVQSDVRVKGAEPFRFVDYFYANDGAGSVMGGVRGLRALVPLMLNPYAPVTVERLDIKVDLSFDTNFGEIHELGVPTAELIAGQRNLVDVQMTTWNGKDVIEQVPVDVPATLAGQIVQLEVTAGDGARLDAAPPVDLPSLYAAIRKLLPGDVWAATLYPAEDGVAVDGKIVRDLPASMQDKLHPESHTQRAAQYKPIARTLSAAKRVVTGSSQMLVRVRARASE
jgi:hypothetical protein